MQNLDDAQLVKRACTGDERAFEVLLNQHYETVFRMAFKWCRVRADAEDITQTVCIKLARALPSYNGRSAFTSWLYRVVVNTAIDWQRRNNGRADSLGDYEPAVRADAEDRLYAREILAQVDALPPKEKTALLLVMSEGLSHAEAAAVMEVKESTVSWYIHEARKKLGVGQGKGYSHG